MLLYIFKGIYPDGAVAAPQACGFLDKHIVPGDESEAGNSSVCFYSRHGRCREGYFPIAGDVGGDFGRQLPGNLLAWLEGFTLDYRRGSPVTRVEFQNPV